MSLAISKTKTLFAIDKFAKEVGDKRFTAYKTPKPHKEIKALNL